MNEHQKCVFHSYKEKYEKAKQELIDLQASRVSSCVEGEDNMNYKGTSGHLEDELRMVGI